MIIDSWVRQGIPETPVSLGYDHVRFVAPVYIGDTITVTYTVSEVDTGRGRTRADITVTNQANETVAVAEHILKWVPQPGAGE